MAMKYCYRDLNHPSMQESLKSHGAVTFKLVKMVAEFSQKMSLVHEQFAHQIQTVVQSFRKKNSEITRERLVDCPSSLLAAWDSLLTEVEMDSQSHMDIANRLLKNVFTPLMEVAAFKKSQAKKLHSFRDGLEVMIDKAEDNLNTLHQQYQDSYQSFQNNNGREPIKNTGSYLNAHNEYVLQLRSCNRQIEIYNTDMLPAILDELEEIHIDTSNTLNAAIETHALLLVTKGNDQCRRFQGILNVCKQVNPKTDVMHFVKSLNPEHDIPIMGKLHGFHGPGELSTLTPETLLQNELIIDKSTEYVVKAKKQSLQKEASDLLSFLNHNQDMIHSLVNTCQRNLANRLYDKVYETQQELCLKRNDNRIANMRLTAIRPQIELLSPKQNGAIAEGQEGEMKPRNTNSIRRMWKRAFKTIKSSDAQSPTNEKTLVSDQSDTMSQKSSKSSSMKRSFLKRSDSRDKKKAEPEPEQKQELDLASADPVYSLLKCASDMSRGKMNQCDNCVPSGRLSRQSSQASGNSPAGAGSPVSDRRQNLKLLHQKSQSVETSEPKHYVQEQQRRRIALSRRKSFSLETPANAVRFSCDRQQQIFKEHQLKSDVPKENTVSVPRPRPLQRRSTVASMQIPDITTTPRQRKYSDNLDVRHDLVRADSAVSEEEAYDVVSDHFPQSPSTSRKRLNLRMKSFSMDAPDTPKNLDESSKTKSNSFTNTCMTAQQAAAYSMSQERRRSRMLRSTSAVDPEGRKHSSRSPSPLAKSRQDQMRQVFPCNLYVVLCNFFGREHDDLTLRAGWRVKAIDTSDPDWWKGRCNGKVGYFPAKYVKSVHPGQKVFQVNSGLQLSEGGAQVKLTRDQVVIQVGPEEHGMILIRVGDKQLRCPIKYLEEI